MFTVENFIQTWRKESRIIGVNKTVEWLGFVR